jgi:hypothetical protein
VVCATAHGTAFARWRKWSAEEKKDSWQLYGWFTASSCLGSVAGMLAFAARTGQFSYRYPRQRLEQRMNITFADSQQVNELRAVEHYFASAFFILFPIELLFVANAQMFLLHRMFQFSLSASSQKHIWHLCGRFFFAIVNAGNIIGICGNIAAASYLLQGSNFSLKVVDAYVEKDYVSAKSFELQALSSISKGASLVGIQRLSEASVLIIIIAAFIVTSVNSNRIIISALRTLFTAEQRVASISGLAGGQARELVAQAGSKGKSLQHKILGTVLVVFVTLLVRSVYSVLYALALSFNQISNPCSRSECDPCKNVYSHILSWILYTPVFEQGTMIVASPLAQIVALWGMSGVRAIEQMKVHQDRITDSNRTASNRTASPANSKHSYL